MCQEGFDEYRRYKRDKDVNFSKYYKLTPKGKVLTTSSELKVYFLKNLFFSDQLVFFNHSKLQVGDMVYVEKKQRVPADMILLKTTEPGGSCFLRTDQVVKEIFDPVKINAYIISSFHFVKTFFSLMAKPIGKRVKQCRTFK
jgi:hypothetical protein